MIEPKARTAYSIAMEEEDLESSGTTLVYLKSEAYRYIAHLKRKRCLAMAERCNSEMRRETYACFRPRHAKEVWREEHEKAGKQGIPLRA